jgi:beta-phosphoglucomutase-like phosphatase (HAD superfamily)
MSFILYKEDYQGRKPDPAPYLKGFKRMEEVTGHSIIPSKCIAVEDDPKGVESAHKAGMTVIHRKLDPNEEDCVFADYSCYGEHDFVAIVTKLLK